MRVFPFIQTSVFVDERFAFSGNQLATFWDKEANKLLTIEEMQGIALEMNFSETTFIEKSMLKECSAKVRIFTPGKELKFAGHPTLGTAFVLKEQNIVKGNVENTTMELGIGPIKVEYNKDSTISMFQPQPNFMDIYNDKEKIANILGLKINDIEEKYPIQAVSTGFPFLIVPIKSLDIIKRISLNAQLQLKTLAGFVTPELLVFTTETEYQDSSVHVRMFAPSAGVLEDPATGSAAGPLGAYLEKWSVLKGHKNGSKMKFEQGFEIKRPSQLIVNNLYRNNIISSVVVSGKVRKMAQSEFYL
ncbi:MAG: PhzF family phenazine biosynthesis protein [Asgard group archaeon]|nr:PhzF family phenazine biosynthesis protein [Asgard group archaeon]